ncbi:MAG: UDP-N-acetylmuramate dehydrogenase [Proteobacteria bacterium]|nr:UDP-N-acetylmuramate dehydrogenase [Pseudomonadota bacterium]
MLECFAAVKGKVLQNHDLSKITWFQVGGPCSYFFRPKDEADLSHFFKTKPQELNTFIIGAGSNLLIRDGGFDGCVIKLLQNFSQIEIDGNTVIAGSGVLDRTLALTLGEKGFSNLEFLVGIPGSIGGAIAMNAGAYGTEIKDHLLWADLMDEKGTIHRFYPQDFNMTYRKGNLPKGYIVLKAAFSLTPKEPTFVMKRLEEILNERAKTQPIRGRTGGSTFKNPADYSAWKLIDDAGCRGFKIGDAQVSEKHCNFLLNNGNAQSSDIETLGEYIRQKVLESSGISLEWEIIRIGKERKAA